MALVLDRIVVELTAINQLDATARVTGALAPLRIALGRGDWRTPGWLPDPPPKPAAELVGAAPDGALPGQPTARPRFGRRLCSIATSPWESRPRRWRHERA